MIEFRILNIILTQNSLIQKYLSSTLMKKFLISTIYLFVGILCLHAQSLPSFDRIILTGNVSALLVEGDQENMEIKNNREELEFKVEGRTLKIISKNLVKYKQQPTVKIIVTYTTLREIKARAGASIYSQQTIETEALSLRFSSGAVGELSVETQSLISSVSEGGSLELQGITNFHEAKSVTGGTLLAYDLDCEDVMVRSNTGGSAKVQANNSIDATAKTGGSISYKGDPRKVRAKDGLSGTIKSY